MLKVGEVGPIVVTLPDYPAEFSRPVFIEVDGFTVCLSTGDTFFLSSILHEAVLKAGRANAARP